MIFVGLLLSQFATAATCGSPHMAEKDHAKGECVCPDGWCIGYVSDACANCMALQATLGETKPQGSNTARQAIGGVRLLPEGLFPAPEYPPPERG